MSGAEQCRCGTPGPTRLYLGGRLGVCCAPPLPPAPEAGTSLAEMRADHGIAPEAYLPGSSTVIDQRAIASGKRRSHPNAYRAARDAEAVS